jgi:hypothetical protein
MREPFFDADAVAMGWNPDKTCYYEVLLRSRGVYTFSINKHYHEEDEGYGEYDYWVPTRDGATSFFDSKEKAEAEAMRIMEYM